MSTKAGDRLAGLAVFVVVILVVVGLVLGGVAGCGAYKGWQRGQARADAKNKVAITAIEIQNLAKTLTDKYLQYEAIKAEEAVATSGQNNTVVYVPSGAMGVPLTQLAPGAAPLAAKK